MSDTIDAYAAALLAVLRAEGDTGADDEILRFAQALEANDESVSYTHLTLPTILLV